VIKWAGRRVGIRRREGARRGLGALRHHRRPIRRTKRWTPCWRDFRSLGI